VRGKEREPVCVYAIFLTSMRVCQRCLYAFSSLTPATVCDKCRTR